LTVFRLCLLPVAPSEAEPLARLLQFVSPVVGVAANAKMKPHPVTTQPSFGLRFEWMKRSLDLFSRGRSNFTSKRETHFNTEKITH
jgi:hypothetical protein